MDKTSNLSDDDIINLSYELKQDGKTFGQIMQYFKSKYDGLYDKKRVSQIVMDMK